MKHFNIVLNDITASVWDWEAFPYEILGHKYTSKCKDGRKEYNNLITAFDIETTTIEGTGMPFDPFDGRTYGFMYVWMFAVDEWNVCVGRTWKEFQRFRNRLLDSIEGKIVTYCHNLSFEFQFMRNFLPEPEKVFARSVREPVYVDYGDQEFRCSYILTNMGLAKFLEKSEGVTVFKASGDEFDYRKHRFPDTELTMSEWDYAIRDVVGLVQGIKSKLKSDGDTLATIPYTSTGYVRRDYLKTCQYDRHNKNRVKRTQLDRWSYSLAETAKRGAIAGSNALLTDETLEGVKSKDRKSSYPHVMQVDYFPDGKFLFRNIKAGSDLFYKQIENKCCIMYVKFTKIKVYSDVPIPYISKSICICNPGTEKGWEKVKYGNGKVYKAYEMYVAITEVDFNIIDECYVFEDFEILKFMSAPRGKLSYAFRHHLAEMFQMKTELENGDKYLYDKYKNKINASFGMMLTAILHEKVVYNHTGEKAWNKDKIKDNDIEWMLEKHYRNIRTFLSYQDGIWTLAHSRKWLFEGLMIPKQDTIATDTDSVKYLDDDGYEEAFQRVNKRIIEAAETFDVKPYAVVGGKKTYLGVWEDDAEYELFRTLGAKKYAYTLKKEKAEGYPLHITVAGLNKATGAEYLDYIGGIDNFKDGVEIPARYYDENEKTEKKGSGRTSSTYNDVNAPIRIHVEGHEVIVGSNVGVTEVSYTIGVTDEWTRLIDGYKVGDVEDPFK